MRRIRRIFWSIVIICVIALCVGLYFRWFNFSAHNDAASNKTVLSFEINRGKFDNAKQEVNQELGSAPGSKTATGTLVKVDDSDHFTVKTNDNKEMTFHVSSDAAKGRLKELQPGDKMSVQYKVEDQENVAQSVTVEWGL